MCLIVTVRLAEEDATRASEICRAANIPTCSQKRGLFGFGKSPSRAVQIPGPDGGCGCSFLAESADWSAPTWDMLPSTLPRLSRILRTIRQHTAAGFAFEALWIGESADEENRVRIDELASLVERSKLGTKTRYLVD
jgi:hypothetical protein